MLIYDYNCKNIEGESIHVKGYNTGSIEAEDSVVIEQYNTGSIASADIHIKEYNTGSIEAMNSVIVDQYNSGSIGALSIRVKGHNAGCLKSCHNITLEGHNTGKVVATGVIEYKGLKITQGRLLEISQGSKITHNDLTLIRRDKKKWEIKDATNGSVNQLEIKDGKIEMVYKRRDVNKGVININGITISCSGSITIGPDGSITIE